MNLFNKISKIIELKNEIYYNSLRINRRATRASNNKSFPSGDPYWLNVARLIKEVAENDQANFFRYPEVILHLASENSSLGYMLLDKISSHPLGRSILNKCSTPPWGAPFLLSKYPFVSPTTLSHIANILSIYDCFGGENSTILDFGGGVWRHCALSCCAIPRY